MLIKALEREREETFQQEKIEGKIEVAKSLLAEGLSIAFIFRVTGLSEEVILKLKVEM